MEMEGELISTWNLRFPPGNLRFPPGFRFHPSDEELIVHYLQIQATSRPLPASIIAEIDLYKYNPWELPKKALFGEGEWYFFTPRDRKYPKGERPNRAAGLGYWKATGTDRPIFSSLGFSKPIGVKKGLVFYVGRPPKGEKTEWFMHEYRLPESSAKPTGHRGSMRLDDSVLCRVRFKGSVPRNPHETPCSYSVEIFKSLPKDEPKFQKSANSDIIADYLDKDCVLLAWILSGGQALLPREANNANDIIRNEKSLNSQTLFPADNCFNLINGETSEENKRKNEGNLSTESLAETDIYGYIKNQPPYVANPIDSFVKFQELNELGITGKYLQY